MKKILLIEDNFEVRENTQEILSLANYEVVVAENGKIGVELAQKEKPELIICDIMMPELDGYGVLHILQKHPSTAGIPFIFLTAKTEKTDIRKGMNLGADDYLTKPFDDTELLTAVEVRLRKNLMQQKSYEPNAEGLDHFLQDARQVLNLKDLCKDNKTKVYKKKVEIFSEGDTPQYIYFIKRGTIKGFKSHPDGKEFITNMYHENDFFGFEPLLEGSLYGESTMAMTDSELTLIPRSDFIMLLQGHADVSKTFIALLCKKVAEKETQLLQLAYNSVRQRTAGALLKSMALKDDDETIKISRDDLAKMVGTAPESVIRMLSDFKDEKLIDIENGKIKILQPNKLEQVVR